jgi:L-lactate dehydrogenase complex protein LldG
MIAPTTDQARPADPASPASSSRATILARIREALRIPAPQPHFKQHAATAPTASGGLTVLPLEAARPWLPDGGDTPAEQLHILCECLGKLRAIVHRVPDMQAATDCLSTLARERDWKQVAYHAHPLVEPLLAGVPCATHRVDASRTGDAPFDKNGLEACDAGITACETLVAQTGSILVSSATCGGRALSILPHVHVVVATLDQIVPTLGDAFQVVRERHAGRLPSMLSFITGPSRTGDIERILVLGAHGPKELIVLLVGADGICP